VLDWEPVTDFDAGFDQTLNWFLAKWSEQLTAV
jgi:dTDP-D-glucose 4,6-dehydratase